jgi:tripartite-type tricarboxylate transporter receptor subunit TctC
MLRILSITAALLCAMTAHSAFAQSYPSRPITMIVPYAAGGPLDLTARVLAEHMTKTLGQAVIVENISGGGGTIATHKIAKATPDGYQLMVQQPALAANVTLFPAAAFDTEKDLMGVALLNNSPMFILASKTLGIKTMPELVAWMKKNDGNIRFAHAGVGSLSHLCAALFVHNAGVKATMIPYRGGTPAISDTIAGHTDIYCSSAQLAISQIQAGTLIGVAVTAKERMSLVPDVPTTSEVGFKDVQANFWQGLFATAGTPKPVADKIGDAVRAALADEAVQKKFEATGMTVYPVNQRNQQATNVVLHDEIKKWGEIIRLNNIQPAAQ